MYLLHLAIMVWLISGQYVGQNPLIYEDIQNELLF